MLRNAKGVLFTIIILIIYIFYTRVLTLYKINENLINTTRKLNITKSLYFLDSVTCKVPYVDPFDRETMDIYEPIKFESCSNESHLVTPIYDTKLERYKLRVDRNVAKQLLNSTDPEYHCFYLEILKFVEDNAYESAKYWTFFESDYVVPQHVQALIVSCREVYNNRRHLQTDAFTLVQYIPPKGKEEPIPQRKPSVLMLGIDSMSRINLRRTMPKVYNSLTKDGWYEMQGYNKVGDNTYPNLMALLSGYSLESVKREICDVYEKGCLERIPLIWKYFKNASYMTALAEDDVDINTFNYMKPGFREQPTDYYLRPYQMAFESKLQKSKCSTCSQTFCIGRRPSSSYVYDMCLNFTRRYLEGVNKRPIWGLFWTNSFSHHNFDLPSSMDNFVLEYLIDLEKVGAYRESIIIFLSDHGARFGKLLKLKSAFLEERLPAMFIYLPPWFRDKYPKYADALRINQNRLTSNYDIHNTLKHIIELDQEQILSQANSCPKCQSLFYPVSKERSCMDAGIPEHFCSCDQFKSITGEWTKTVAWEVVEHINKYLKLKNLSLRCVPLTLKKIHNIGIQKSQDTSPKITSLYHVSFTVNERNARFHATLTFNNITKNGIVDIENISRTNIYRDDSKCIDNEIDKLYCICYSRV